MKVLLISPPEKHMLVEAGDRPPLSILYLGAALKEKGHEVLVSDLNHDSYYRLREKIKVLKPEFIGMTFSTPYFEWAINFARHLRHNYPNIKLIAGGPHASADPISLTNDFDFVIMGEGERAIVDLVGGNKNQGNLIKYPIVENLDELPPPAWELIPVNKYGINQEGHRTAVILSSRGCPMYCFFCSKAIMGRKFRMHSVNRIISEMKVLKNNYHFDSFYFIDDCFTINPDRVLEFAKRMQKERLGTFRITSRTDTITEEMMIELKKAGLRSISYGLEHMDDNVLMRIKKCNSVKYNIKAVKLAKKYGIAVRGSFIMNLPGASKETMYDCLKFAMEENLDFADFYPLIAYQGTSLWNEPEKYNVKIIDKSYDIYQTSGKTNVKIFGLTLKKTEAIIKDINSKWRKFKGTNTPWELKR